MSQREMKTERRENFNSPSGHGMEWAHLPLFFSCCFWTNLALQSEIWLVRLCLTSPPRHSMWKDPFWDVKLRGAVCSRLRWSLLAGHDWQLNCSSQQLHQLQLAEKSAATAVRRIPRPISSVLWQNEETADRCTLKKTPEEDKEETVCGKSFVKTPRSFAASSLSRQ